MAQQASIAGGKCRHAIMPVLFAAWDMASVVWFHSLALDSSFATKTSDSCGPAWL